MSRSQFEHPLVMVEPTDHGLQVCIRSPVCDQDIPFPAAAMAQANHIRTEINALTSCPTIIQTRSAIGVERPCLATR